MRHSGLRQEGAAARVRVRRDERQADEGDRVAGGEGEAVQGGGGGRGRPLPPHHAHGGGGQEVRADARRHGHQARRQLQGRR